MKTVEYNGYEMKVPSSWPVYQLNKDPRQCVRYDINAVYLGTPSPNQNCPPGLIGRADTVSIGGPAAPGQPTTPVRTGLRAAVGDLRQGPNMTAVPGTIMQNTNSREFAVSMPNRGFSVSATYGSNPDLIMQLLASLRTVSTGQHRGQQNGRHPGGCQPAAGHHTRGRRGDGGERRADTAAHLDRSALVLARADAHRDRHAGADAHCGSHYGSHSRSRARPARRWPGSTPAPPPRCRP